MFVPNPFPKAFPDSPYKRKNPSKRREDKGNVYLNFLADLRGCGQYRRMFFENFANLNDLAQSTTVFKMIFDKNWYRDVRCITLQRQASSEQKTFFEFLKSIQKEMGFKMVYEIDDVVFREEIPDYNIYKHAFDNDEIRQNCVDMINMSDEVTVTCDFMRRLYQDKTGKNEVTVVPNFMPYNWIGYQYNYQKNINNFDKHKKKPRIAYSGSGAHYDVKNLNGGVDDFSHILKFVIDNVDKYQFVFIGSYPPPLRHLIEQRKVEYHPWQSLYKYPSFLYSLDAQLFLAPLNDNNFNKSKSDIKFIESCQLGVPCMVQDMETYQDAPDFLKFNNWEDLSEKVETLLNWKNRSKYYSLVPKLRQIGEGRFLDRPENYNCFIECFNTPFGDDSRKYLKNWNP